MVPYSYYIYDFIYFTIITMYRNLNHVVYCIHLEEILADLTHIFVLFVCVSFVANISIKNLDWQINYYYHYYYNNYHRWWWCYFQFECRCMHENITWRTSISTFFKCHLDQSQCSRFKRVKKSSTRCLSNIFSFKNYLFVIAH